MKAIKVSHPLSIILLVRTIQVGPARIGLKDKRLWVKGPGFYMTLNSRPEASDIMDMMD